MNKYGFYINKLTIEGDGKEKAEVTFSRGLNVIYGASDTGKTFVYQCIDYMLGSRSIPKDIPEARSYTTCKLEIQSYRGKIYLLERNLTGGDFRLVTQDSTTEILVSENNKKKGKTISDFFLELCNLSNKKVRKNVRGETQKLYFQSLHRFFLVGEENIITQDSPVRTTQYTQKTFEENIFRLILSEKDDSEIVATLNKDEITNKKGRIELYDELIDNLKKELPDKNYENIDIQISKLNEFINRFRSEYLVSSQEFKIFDKQKRDIYSNILKKERLLLSINESLKRSKILWKQYNSDILRLKGTLEAGHAFNNISTSNCPLCDHVIRITDNSNVKELIPSINKEIEKIELLISELNESNSLFLNEKNDTSSELGVLREKHDSILSKIRDELNDKLIIISNKLKEVSSKKESLSKIKTLNDKLNEYLLQRNNINIILEKNKELGKDTKYDKLTKSLLEPIVNNIYKILIEINFYSISSVTYSEEDHDFIIGDKKRSNFGKGYRAIIYAVYILALYEYLNMKPYRIGMVMIDSPLNPYKPDDEADNGSVSKNLANNFYAYLVKNVVDEQVILIENTEVPENLINKINYIVYTKKHGFIPKEKT